MLRRKRRREGSRQGRGDKRQCKGDQLVGYPDLVKENTLLVKYYKGQGIVPSQEWDQFLSTLKENLPATFRITGSRALAEAVRSCLERKFFAELVDVEVEGERVPPPRPIPWYPNRLAWHVNLSKRFIRKSPLLSKFHSFLVRENEQGNISRQEAVSMVPPMLLDVQPHHKVLDMCAAPGSKTAQLIEFLHAEDTDSSPIPSGVVVANDADNKRCYMLVHQAKRLNSPAFMVTNHDASVFPMLYFHDDNDVRHPLFYDRILCDVPCSGDGTLRKNPIIWRRWTTSLGQGVHRLQLRILNRGLELLAPGGHLVYSTCSLNPVEDEAVIAAELKLCKGAVELVDCSNRLPGLKRVPGLTSWKLMTKHGEWLSSPADIPKSFKQLITATQFPPEEQEAKEMHLNRCMRILPHHQDSGGFFVALLCKKDWLPWQRKRRLATADTTQQNGSSQPTSLSSMTARLAPLEKDIPSSSTQGTALDTTSSTQETALDTTSSTQETALDTTSSTQETATSSTTIITSAATSSIPQEINTVTMTSQGMSPNEEKPTDDSTIPIVTSAGALNESVTAQQEEGADVVESGNGFLSAGDTVQLSGGQGTSTGSCESRVEDDAKFKERPPADILGKPSSQRQHKGYKEDPYVFLAKDSDIYQLIRPYYGLPESFPSDQLLTRSLTSRKRNIYLASRLVKELTRRNGNSVKIINIGVKVLARCDHPKTTCTFRLTQEPLERDWERSSTPEALFQGTVLRVLRAQGRLLLVLIVAWGIDAMSPYITSHCVRISQDDLVRLLQEPNPLTTSLSQLAQEAIHILSIGPVLFQYMPSCHGDESCHGDGSIHKDESGHEDGSNKDTSAVMNISCPLYLSGWLAAKSVRLYVDKNYRYHFLAMLGYDPPENQSLETIGGQGRRGGRVMDEGESDNEEGADCGESTCTDQPESS